MQSQSLVLFLTISLSSCLPQLNEGPYSYWRNHPRSIPSNFYYLNQPAAYQNPYEVSGSNGQQEYRDRSNDNRARGPFARNDYVKEERIMNYPPPERVSMGDPMLNDQYQNGDFVFPGLINTPRTTVPTKKPVIVSRNPYVPDINAILKNCPSGATFCESVDYYPSDYIHNALQENAETFNDLFGMDELIPSNVNVTTRIGVGDSDGTPMCAASERVIQPPVAKNANEEWKFIVNSEQYVQGIRVEICQNSGKQCAMSENFPLSYQTECKQKYIFRKLLALDASGEMQTDNFRLPSCCVCVFRAARKARSVFGLK